MAIEGAGYKWAKIQNSCVNVFLDLSYKKGRNRLPHSETLELRKAGKPWAEEDGLGLDPS